MSLYRNTTTGEVRDLDDSLVAAWVAAGNPKASQWEAYTPPPPPPPPPPAPDWAGFATWLYQFPAMAAAMAAARTSLSPQGEPATTGLPAAMDEARLRANYLPFAQGWALFLAASGLTETNLVAIINVAELCHLPPDFLAALQPPLPEPPQ